MTLLREWQALEETASRRRAGAKRLLEYLLAGLPPGSRGTDLLAETTLGKLLAVLTADPVLKSSKRPEKLLERALMWLHEQEVIHLHRGLAVFRQAMTIQLTQEQPRRGFARADFEPLKLYYEGQVRQVHVMGEFARRGLRCHGRGAAAGYGLLLPAGGGIPAPLAAGPSQGDRAGDHARIVADHCRELEESDPAADRHG